MKPRCRCDFGLGRWKSFWNLKRRAGTSVRQTEHLYPNYLILNSDDFLSNRAKHGMAVFVQHLDFHNITGAHEGRLC